MKLDNNRDYRILTKEEKERYSEIVKRERGDREIGCINLFSEYPYAVKMNLSLFPNNCVILSELKSKYDLHVINKQFEKLIHDRNTRERDIAYFIKHTPAFHIIGAILEGTGFRVGHHDTVIFPEFQLGNKYRVDYLIIGKGSGGYEFVFVELEAPNKEVALKNGYKAKSIRSGENQLNDWKRWLECNYVELKDFFEKEKNFQKELPKEFREYDSSRMHFVVVSGLRKDYNETAYRNMREDTNGGIVSLHYDHLFDFAEKVLSLKTF